VKAASARNQTSESSNLKHSGVTFTGTTACALTAVTDCFGVGPADFGTIYNVSPLWNAGIDGTGQTIAIVTDSNIAIEDAQEFRAIFGLPAKDPVVTLNGSDPGLLANGDEVEAILDVEWSGAIARNANINLVVSASTNSTFGGDLSANFIVDETPSPSILSYSFGACELGVGTAGNLMYNNLWSKAALENITVIVATGDNGSASCDTTFPAPGSCGFSASAVVEAASCGLQVNGIASTPFDIAVGGTEFNDIANPLNFWSANNATVSLASALSYIPEMTYNDSCTEPAVVNFFGLASAEAACNNGTVEADLFDSVAGGGGGLSNCITSDGVGPFNCTGGYAKPAWQVALTPADAARDLPDVSLFAGDGTISGSFYIVCNRDFSGITGVCDLNTGNFLNVGGTSVSAQVFAGIMALVDQKNESAQGNANLVIYPLAVASPPGSCNSAGPPASTCVFNDVSVGTIAMPCAVSTINCVVLTPGDSIGVLSGYVAGTGYDLATGLGSVNAANFVNAAVWTSTTKASGDFTLSLSSPTVTVASPGAQGTVTLTVAAEGGFTGTVTPTCSALPDLVTCSGSAVTGSGTTTITFTTTAAGKIAPTSRPNPFGSPTVGGIAALTCAFSMVLLLGFWDRRRRLGMAFALTTFALLVGIVGCGGGSSSTGSTGPSTAVGTTTVVITGTSGTIQRSVAVTLTVN
jgi:subtilase family serine protease